MIPRAMRLLGAIAPKAEERIRYGAAIKPAVDLAASLRNARRCIGGKSGEGGDQGSMLMWTETLSVCNPSPLKSP